MEKILRIIQNELFNIRIIFGGGLIKEDRNVLELKINFSEELENGMHIDCENLRKDRVIILKDYKKALAEKKIELKLEDKTPLVCL